MMQYFTNLETAKKALFWQLPKVYDAGDIEIYKYALGANLYMTGLMDLYERIVTKRADVNTVTICFEDAISEADIPACEIELVRMLDKLTVEIANGLINREQLPGIFIRVRNVHHFEHLLALLTPTQFVHLQGFIFPKFTSENGEAYLSRLKAKNDQLQRKLYAMPILESPQIIYRESRTSELMAIQAITDQYRELVLNIRSGGTDFSSTYGLRRSVRTSVYDVNVVSECLSDIVNIFARQSAGYVVSGPVWEYFSADFGSLEVQGLIREVALDKENGLFGKTTIHPFQVNYINYQSIVTYEEYCDALKIHEAHGGTGVFKGEGNNKMNEIAPHSYWAQKVLIRAHIFGVLKPNVTYADLWEQGAHDEN